MTIRSAVVMLLAMAACKASSPAAIDAATNPQPADAASDAPAVDGAQPYSHTIIIDGADDFVAAERFATTTALDTAAISWDPDFLYVAITAADVSSGSASRLFVIYSGAAGATGSTVGVTNNTQTPSLPFDAGHYISWNAATTSLTAMMNVGAGWLAASLDATTMSSSNGNFLELRIKRSDVGAPTTSLQIAMAVVDSQSGVEETHAGVPSIAFVDGFDPDIATYFDFDLTSHASPVSYTPKP